MNGKVEGEDVEEEYMDEEEEDDEEEDEEEHPEEKEGEKYEEKDNIIDVKRKEMEEQKQNTTEPDIQKKQTIKEPSVPDGPIKESIIKEETQSERNGVTGDKPKTFFGSKNRLSLFKRSSTKGNQAESATSHKPADDCPPQISETQEPDCSSSETQMGQTTKSGRSRSATCNLL